MKKILLLFCLSLFAGGGAWASDEERSAVCVWVPGSHAYYLLSESPRVSYSEGAAVLWIGEDVVLRLPLEEGKSLRIAYATNADYEDGIANVQPPHTLQVSRKGTYTLDGRRLESLEGMPAGIYIVNGRKMMKK